MEQTFSLQMGGGQIANVSPYDDYSNELTQPVSYDELVFKDIQEMLFNGKTLDEHYNTVISTQGNTYNGMEKFVYGHIIKAFQTIIELKGKRRGKYTRKEEIAFLHQDIGFSPTLIRDIVRLFNIKLDIPQILDASYSIFAERPPPAWLRNIRNVSGTL